jgi:hypothetical protein
MILYADIPLVLFVSLWLGETSVFHHEMAKGRKRETSTVLFFWREDYNKVVGTISRGKKDKG